MNTKNKGRLDILKKFNELPKRLQLLMEARIESLVKEVNMNTKSKNEANNDMIEYGMALEKFKQEITQKNYNISFYTLEDMQNNAEPTYYIEYATSHDIDIIDTLIDNDKEHNFAHFDGAIIDLNQFTVIRYEEEEDEE